MQNEFIDALIFTTALFIIFYGIEMYFQWKDKNKK